MENESMRQIKKPQQFERDRTYRNKHIISLLSSSPFLVHHHQPTQRGSQRIVKSILLMSTSIRYSAHWHFVPDAVKCTSSLVTNTRPHTAHRTLIHIHFGVNLETDMNFLSRFLSFSLYPFRVQRKK